MNNNRVLSRAIVTALGIGMAVALAACSKTGAPQAGTSPANFTTPAGAATAPLPQEAGAAAPGGAPTAAQPEGAAPMQPAGNAPAQPQFAQVVAVRPVTQSVTTSKPRQECRDEQVAVPETYKDKHQIGGAVVGGLVGALAGHQIGGGKGKDIATLGGAAAGAFAGHEIQKNHQEKNATREETRNVCHTVTDKSTTTKTVGYDVTYTLNGQQGHVRMDRNPGVGSGLPVENGRVVANRQSGDYYQ